MIYLIGFLTNLRNDKKTNGMIREEDIVVMKAVALCFKKHLKPEEAMIYCNLGRTQLAKKCEQLGIYKNAAGYYLREQLDHIFESDPNHQAINSGDL